VTVAEDAREAPGLGGRRPARIEHVSQINPMVVRVVEAPTPETTVADVLMGAVGFVGFVLAAALVIGLLAGAVFIAFRKLRARMTGESEIPPVSASQLTR
jgi:hypothetical protein